MDNFKGEIIGLEPIPAANRHESPAVLKIRDCGLERNRRERIKPTGDLRQPLSTHTDDAARRLSAGRSPCFRRRIRRTEPGGHQVNLSQGSNGFCRRGNSQNTKTGCRRITVSGLTIWNASRQPLQIHEKDNPKTPISRIFGRLIVRCITDNCWRRAMISIDIFDLILSVSQTDEGRFLSVFIMKSGLTYLLNFVNDYEEYEFLRTTALSIDR